MYSPAFQTLLADARVEDLRRAARGTSTHPSARRERWRRAASQWGLLSRARTARLVFADPSRVSAGPRS
jgi:hypothetical protein